MELTKREKQILLDMLEKELHLHGDLGYAEMSAIMKKLQE